MSHYVLNLYVTGQSPRSVRAEANLRHICEEYLAGRYDLAVVDILKRPDLAEAANIFATPATVRVQPSPAQRVIGDLGDPSRVLSALGIDAGMALPSDGEQR